MITLIAACFLHLLICTLINSSPIALPTVTCVMLMSIMFFYFIMVVFVFFLCACVSFVSVLFLPFSIRHCHF